MNDKKDYLNGDYSFKKWIKIMGGNSYVFLFFVGLFGMIYQIVMWDEMMEMIRDNYSYSIMGAIMVTIGMLIPTAIAGIISYKGFFQFWNDLKNKKSR